jgi:kynurenine 3-monooxygenase
VLWECLEKQAPRWEAAFAAYGTARKIHTDTLADLAVENFVEMRDKTGSRVFRIKKTTETLLAKVLPGWYLPLYGMVTFSRTPYAAAVRRAKMQDRLVKGLAALVLLALVLMAAAALW